MQRMCRMDGQVEKQKAPRRGHSLGALTALGNKMIIL